MKKPKYLQEREEAEAKRYKAKEESDRQGIVDALHSISRQIQGITSNFETSEERRDKRNDDRQLGNRKYRLDRRAVVLSAALTLGTVVILGMQTWLLKGQIKVMQIEQRPWISANTVTVEPLSYDVNGLRVTLDFLLANSGHNPAEKVFINVKAFGSPFPNNTSVRQLPKAELAVCNQSHEIIGAPMFPGDHAMHPVVAYVYDAEVKQSFGMMPVPGVQSTHKFLVPYIIACIVYKDVVTGDWHRTPYLFTIMAVKDGIPSAISMDDTAALPKMQVVIQSQFFGDLDPN